MARLTQIMRPYVPFELDVDLEDLAQCILFWMEGEKSDYSDKDFLFEDIHGNLLDRWEIGYDSLSDAIRHIKEQVADKKSLGIERKESEGAVYKGATHEALLEWLEALQSNSEGERVYVETEQFEF